MSLSLRTGGGLVLRDDLFNFFVFFVFFCCIFSRNNLALWGTRFDDFSKFDVMTFNGVTAAAFVIVLRPSVLAPVVTYGLLDARVFTATWWWTATSCRGRYSYLSRHKVGLLLHPAEMAAAKGFMVGKISASSVVLFDRSSATERKTIHNKIYSLIFIQYWVRQRINVKKTKDSM